LVPGARACPPEDCGGPGGYEALVSAMREPGTASAKELREWLGRRFAPEAFSLAAVNRRLR
jgi:hypothetical protein